MPFNLYGSRPRSKEGKHFRYTLGAWHPLWGYCELIAPDLIPADNLGHVNEGWGLEEADALKLADRLAGELESGNTRRYEQARRAWYESLPSDPGNADQERSQRPNLELSSLFTLECVRSFEAFLRECGGFRIW